MGNGCQLSLKDWTKLRCRKKVAKILGVRGSWEIFGRWYWKVEGGPFSAIESTEVSLHMDRKDFDIFLFLSMETLLTSGIGSSTTLFE